jgi:hypothetical protein
LRFPSSEGSNLSSLSMSAALGAVPLVVSDSELREAVALELLDFELPEPDEGDRLPDFRDLGEFAVASGTAPSPQVSLTCSAGSTFDRPQDFLHLATRGNHSAGLPGPRHLVRA